MDDLNIENEKQNQIILLTLVKQIEKYKQYISLFNLNEENFSKALKIELDVFSKEIKNEENIFNSIEKGGLIFFSDKSFKIQDDSDLFLNRLNLLKSSQEIFNTKLKLMKTKLNSGLNNNDTSLTNVNPDFDFNFNLNKLKKLISSNDIKVDLDGNYDNISKQFNKVEQIRNEIISLNNQSLQLKIEKENLEKRLKSFVNLPSDVNKIKDMIKIKQKEFDEINN